MQNLNMFWERYSHDAINQRVEEALQQNINLHKEPVLGIPGTYLDQEEFYEDAPFLQDAPFLRTLIANPNHIGCHTLSDNNLSYFKGTQQLETELIRICAEQIFGGQPNQQDGYVTPGGTEANIQAMWTYRNYFMHEKKARPEEIAVLFSQDSHYSMPKGVNLLGLPAAVLPVDDRTRQINQVALEKTVAELTEKGIKHFILILNLSTTMFGSVDDISRITTFLKERNLDFRLHIDAAFGGFIYPFTNPESAFSFLNPDITSITIDAHKMLQTPYGTGIFLIRKGLMEYVCTEEAQYIPGKDFTLCGSRSGANAISVWMILRTHGSEGWRVKMQQLNDRTTRLCHKLTGLGIEYFRNPYINIIAIRSSFVSAQLAAKYHLVADTYEREPAWYKIVVMPHVRQGILDQFISELQAEQLPVEV